MEMKYRRNTKAVLLSSYGSSKNSLPKREQVLLRAKPSSNNVKKPLKGQMEIKVPKKLKYEYKDLPEFAQTTANIR